MLKGTHAYRYACTPAPCLHQDSGSLVPLMSIFRMASTYVHNFTHPTFLPDRRDSDHARLPKYKLLDF